MYLQKPIRSLFLLLFPCFLLVLSSCQSDQESSTPSSEGQGTLSFTVSNYRQISFDDISSSSSTRAPTIHRRWHICCLLFIMRRQVSKLSSQSNTTTRITKIVVVRTTIRSFLSPCPTAITMWSCLASTVQASATLPLSIISRGRATMCPIRSFIVRNSRLTRTPTSTKG